MLRALREDLAGRVAPLGRAAAETAGQRAARPAGRPVDVSDALIAGIALDRRARVARSIPGLPDDHNGNTRRTVGASLAERALAGERERPAAEQAERAIAVSKPKTVATTPTATGPKPLITRRC